MSHTYGLRLLGRTLLCACALVIGLQCTVVSAQDAADLRLVKYWEAPVKVDGGEEVYRVEIYFDYARGEAKKLVYNAAGTTVEESWMPGQPRATRNELEEAFGVVKDDAEFGALVAQHNAIVDGGFILVEEAGNACAYPGSRCIQVDIMTNSGLRRLRYVIVDLMTKQIVYRNYQPVTSER